MKKLHREGYGELHLAEATEHRLEADLKKAAGSLGVSLRFSASPMFLTPVGWLNEYFEKNKTCRMAGFYIAQRRRMDVLVERDNREEGNGVLTGKTANASPEVLKFPRFRLSGIRAVNARPKNTSPKNFPKIREALMASGSR